VGAQLHRNRQACSAHRRRVERAPGSSRNAPSFLSHCALRHCSKLDPARCRADRLGRSTRELLNLIDQRGKAGALFRSLGDPLWDTSSAQGRLLSTLLVSIAEFERELIRERTGEGRKRAMAAGIKFGRKRAMAAGIKFGRKRKLSDFQRAEAIKRRAAGETLASIAKSYGVHLAMISRF
jgi:DNA invertase Pin-like site-specific DNA recombinase